jgi:ligand-binding SRPBCC domain-containing protein
MRLHHLERQIDLPSDLQTVFAFFADAGNLEALTPSWLHFEILTPPPIALGTGIRVDYRLRLHGLPLRWTSEITVWDPPRRFVDEQRRGPYRVWIHEHEFERLDDGRTRLRDRVRYAVPGGALVNRLFVAPDLDRIFRFRHARIRDLLG